MNSLLNPNRPPVFCPGCAHDRVVQVLDRTFRNMGLSGDRIAIVSDIGCSGLFDTFFNTHAFHGLHGRALTYATGIKMARPELHVVVTMGDGGLGIGGAHVLSTCRRNIDLTLLVLNNFNYGMTGGQCSPTTPRDAQVSSGFLNRLEQPLDIGQVAGAAGAGFVSRVSTYDKGLIDTMEAAIRFDGFSVVDIWGICPGRYTRRNRITPGDIGNRLDRMPPLEGFSWQNTRTEYTRAYRDEAVLLPPVPEPVRIETLHTPPRSDRRELVILGSAGQRVVTAGELVCLAGATAGLHATQKNDYPITVMRGHSVAEMILSAERIGYTGIQRPSTVIALAQEGVNRRRTMFGRLPRNAVVIQAKGVDLPPCDADIIEVDFKGAAIKSQDWALASLALLARKDTELSPEMLQAALGIRFKGKTLEKARSLVAKAEMALTG